MPKALPLGISFDEFWTLNPHKLDIIIKAFNEKTKAELKQKNMLMYMQGIYVLEALNATVGNMFRGKGQKPFEYPDEPHPLDFDAKKPDEIELKRRAFVTKLNNLFRDIDHTLQERENGDR